MAEQVFQVTLTVLAPVLSQSTAAGALGVDASSARRDGRVVLPGSLVKGKVREAWERLRTLAPEHFDADVGQWLGPRDRKARPEDSRNGDTNAPRRGRVFFSDFQAESPEDGGLRYRVRLDASRGSVDHGALAAVETPFAPGREVAFRGTVRFHAEVEEAARIRHALEAGLRWIENLGAFRSHGFGRLVGVGIEERPRRTSSVKPVEASSDGRLDFVLRVEDPLVVSRFLPDGNLFECDHAIPGAALKGAVATTWRAARGLPLDGAIKEEMDAARSELARHFASVRFTHAFLGHADPPRRPVAAPLSLVRAAGKIWDVAALDGVHLFVETPVVEGQEVRSLRAPAFAPDWKRRSDVEAALGWASPERETRVRTAIDSAIRRGAEGELFAYRAILPSPALAFYGTVDLSEVPPSNRAAAARQLQSLLADGLRFLGKTKAAARVEFRPGGSVAPAVPSATPEPGQPWIVALQTPAVLLDPLALDEAAGRTALFEAYRSAWENLAGGGLELVRTFTRQRLAGGGYLWRRFQGDQPYHPFLLTEPGSVFVFNVAEASAADVLRAWERHGLPLPGWALERYAGRCADGEHRPGNDWRRCPFIRENGFGEVGLNPVLPWKRPPDHLIQRVEEVRS